MRPFPSLNNFNGSTKQLLFGVLFIIACFGFLTPVARAATYYVDGANGSSTYDGTELTHTTGSTGPFATIGQANLVAVAGDTVYIRAGTYSESIAKGNSGTPGNPITYAAYNGETVIMDGSRIPSAWTVASGSIYQVTSWDPPYAGLVWQDDTTFLTQAANEAAMTAGSWYYNSGSSTLYVWCTDGASPSTHTINASWLNVAWYSASSTGNTAKSYITLNGLTIRMYGRAIEADPGSTSNDWELNNIDVSYSPAEAVFVTAGGENSSDWYVHNSRFHNNHGHGLQINGDGTRILYNEFDHNEWGGAYTNGGGGLIVSGSSTGAIIEYNKVHDNGTNFGSGIMLETAGTTGATVEYNDIYGNRNGGVSVSGATNNIIAYNQIHDNWRGGSITSAAAIQLTYDSGQAPFGAATGNLIYGNTINNNYGGIYVDASSSIGTVIENNIVRNSENQTLDVLGTSTVLDYNDYLANALTLSWNGSSYSTLATYQSASNQDSHSLNTDPLWNSVVYGWDGFERGNLTCSGDGGWWNVASCSGATLTDESTVVHSGLYSAQVSWTATGQSAGAYQTIPAVNNGYVQFALNVGSMAGSSAQLNALNYTYNVRMGIVLVRQSTTTYTINLIINASDGNHTYTGSTVLNDGTWYTIEANYVAGSASGGGGELWINGTPEASNFTLNTAQANNQPTRAYVGLEGSLSGSTSGTIYIDDYRYDTTYIGSRAITDYSLSSSSPAIDSGTNVGSTYRLGLAEGSTWPSSVTTLNQNGNGSGWEMGAYVYTQTSTPSIAWISPSNNATVSSTVTLSASSTAVIPAAISSMQFYLDGSPLGSPVTSTSSSNTYSYSWNTASVSNASHTLYALATDDYGNSASSSPITVTVSNPAILFVPTSTLNFSAVHGSTATSSQSVVVTNNGTAYTSLNWSASSNESWLTFSPASSSLAGNASTSVSFITNPSGLAIGTYNATATITASGATNSPQYIPVTLTVSTTGIGTTLLSPTDDTIATGTISLSTTATSTVGIASVQFYLDGSPLGTAVTSSPYTISWNTNTASDGSHTLCSLATDNDSNTASSSEITVTVDNTPPVVSITAPASGATVSGTTSTTASSSDAITGVSSVSFYLDGSLIGESTSSPYTISWDSTQTSNGAHSITAIAVDGAGNATTSQAISVTVSNSMPSSPPAGVAVSVAAGYAPAIPPPVSSTTVTTASTTPSASATSSVSTSSLQAELDMLLAELQSLEAQAGDGSTITPSLSSPSSPYVFTTDLELWDTGPAVTALQSYLIAEDKGSAAQRLKQHGTTDVFGMLTYDALVEFQASVGIHATGYFGSITRAYVNWHE